MDSDEEHPVDEENVTSYESDDAFTELKQERNVHSSVNHSDRESSYAPSDHSINFEPEYGLSGAGHHGSRSPLKRPAEEAAIYRPFKRQKGVLNTEYLDILNRDIDDVATRVCLEDPVDLPPSQVGLTTWSSVEKHQFFEALSRLGKYDLPGIASRIGSKSEIEVKQYIHLLEEAKQNRSSINRRSYLESAEYPAAVEISQPCCHAQDEAADAISVRQEAREEQREELKWGENWDITPSLARRLSRRAKEGDFTSDPALRFSQLFHSSNWLRLSERVFMNSSIPGNSWKYIDDKEPSIWATAFDDFHSLAVSVTRRLVQATLFISMSRIRAKKEIIPTTRDVVRRKDVEAAIASLGMPHNSHELWMKSARRLRLDVFDEPPHRDDENAEDEPMTYDEVEAALAGDGDENKTQAAQESNLKLELSSDSDLEGDNEEEDNYDTGIDSEAGANQKVKGEEYEVTREANEILWYSALELKDIPTAKQAIKLRVTMERKQEAQADLRDEYASYQAEAEMWNVLQKKPPMELPRAQEPGRIHRSNLNVENLYPLGGDWASKLEYYGEWEVINSKEEE